MKPAPIDVFSRALAFVLRWEGGKKFTDDPDDPGGATKYGISLRAARGEGTMFDLDHDGDVDADDIKLLAEDDAADFYLQNYWYKLDCDKLPVGLGIALFDAGVNCGVGRARQFLAKSGTALTLLKEREDFYRGLVLKKPKLVKYLPGWLNRVAALHKEVA